MIDPELTFAGFEVGASNELAAAAARRVAENPGGAYNPLVIRGDIGTGRTHLLHAIANHARALENDLQVRLESVNSIADELTSRLVTGASGTLDEELAAVVILLVDDLEHVSGLDRTQDELARLGARMVDDNRQIVFASLFPPTELPGLTPEFRRLLDRGTVIDIDPPDAELRRAIARRAASALGATLPDDVLRAIGDHDLRDARDIISTVRRLLGIAADESRPPAQPDLLRSLPEGASANERTDEFGSFLSDISLTLESVVETAPWRRRIAEAILRWEGEGIRTARLERALDADTAPDVDALLDEFARDAGRLLEIRAAPGARPGGAPLDGAGAHAGVQEAAERVRAADGAAVPRPGAGTGEAGTPTVPSAEPWFLDPSRVILDWTEIDARVADTP